MSGVSRCLGPMVARLSGQHRTRWKAHIDALPERCSHADCTARGGCRAYVAAYFRVQWHAQVNRERIDAMKMGVARG